MSGQSAASRLHVETHAEESSELRRDGLGLRHGFLGLGLRHLDLWLRRGLDLGLRHGLLNRRVDNNDVVLDLLDCEVSPDLVSERREAAKRRRGQPEECYVAAGNGWGGDVQGNVDRLAKWNRAGQGKGGGSNFLGVSGHERGADGPRFGAGVGETPNLAEDNSRRDDTAVLKCHVLDEGRVQAGVGRGGLFLSGLFLGDGLSGLGNGLGSRHRRGDASLVNGNRHLLEGNAELEHGVRAEMLALALTCLAEVEVGTYDALVPCAGDREHITAITGHTIVNRKL
mmetsp:Transcript_64729/g.141011  ORF Transcript_64729/g.141011 Transcript_64729/m.141011 type:complete len:284 (-) Transcript_64729:378-1229(-)